MPDYTRPGEAGTPPPAGLPKASVGVRRQLPFSLDCGRDHTLEVTVRQDVSACTGIDYHTLYRRADQLLDGSIGRIRCDPDDPTCSKHVREMVRDWGCRATGTGADARHVAHVTVARRLFCRAQAPPGSWLDPADATTFGAGGGHEGPPNPGAQDGVTWEIGPTPGLRCGESRRYTLAYTGAEEGCPDGDVDFEPHVTAALARVDDLVGALGCAPPCVKRTEIDWQRWRCAGTSASVDVAFTVRCVQPPPGEDDGSGSEDGSSVRPGCFGRFLVLPFLLAGRRT